MRHRHRTPVDRIAIADDNAPVPPAHWPTRWTVRRVRSIGLVLVGLAFAASLLSVYLTYEAAQESAAQAAAVDRRLSVLEDDLAERTRQRDAERDAAAALEAARDQQLRSQIGAVLCDLLADLPPRPGLDQVRATLGCPERGATPAANPGQSPPGTAAPAPPGESPTPGQPPASASPTPPAASPDPVPPPGPLDLLCGLLPPLC